MIPLHLKLKGFLSYLDPVDLDFTGFNLACISGSNGAGKSSLLDAITWALFGQARKTDDSLIHTQAKDHTAEVVLDFAYETNTYRIQRTKTRDKSTRLELFIASAEEGTSTSTVGNSIKWKSITEKSVRDTETRIRQILRLDYETFINASFFLQGKADQFAQQRPGDRKRILSSILGLEVWEEYHKRAIEHRSKTEEDVARIDGQLQEIDTELSEGPARQARLEELQRNLEILSNQRKAQAETFENLKKLVLASVEQRRWVDSLKKQLADALSKQNQLVTLLTDRKTEFKSYQDKLEHASEIEAAYQNWQSARQTLANWEDIAASFRQQQEKRQAPLLEIESERSRLVQEEQNLSTQEQGVAQSIAEIPRWTEQLTKVMEEIGQAKAQLERRKGLEEEIRQHHQSQADARVENPRLKTEMDDLKARIQELEASISPTCPLCGQELTPEHRQELIKELNTQGKQLAERYRQNQALLRDFEMILYTLEKELVRLNSVEETLRQKNRLEDQINDQLVQIEQLKTEWAAKGEPRVRKIRNLLQQNAFALEAREKLSAIDAELKATGYDPQVHQKIRQEELAGRSSEISLRALENARATLAPLERELANLETQQASQEEEVSRFKIDFDQAFASWEKSSNSIPDLNQAEDELFQLQEKENRLRNDVGGAYLKVTVLEKKSIEKKGLSQDREEKNRRISRLKTLERAFGKDGVPALLIEQALPEIQDEANLILERLSGGTMSVQFATQKEFKDKNRDDKKETLDIQISDVYGMRDYELFSGGEAFRINFAIRLALSRVLTQRAGARLQTLVIDEGFGSQDAEGRQRLIEAINLVSPDFSKILIITHLEELKEAFPTRIEVEKTNRGSVVRII